MTCRHPDIRTFGELRCCLACGATIFSENAHHELVKAQATDLPYRYRRLDYELGQEIRLLKILPGTEKDDIECTIEHVNLLDNPSYEALSYTWATQDGDSSLSQYIRCNDQRVAITKNCEAAIRSLRWPDFPRVLWIDAICIDQSNHHERNHQVSLMDAIYSGASRVCVYLGPRSRITDLVLLNAVQNSETSPGFNTASLNEFLKIGWFSRIWVIQEVALAKRVCVGAGNQYIRWDIGAFQHLCRKFGKSLPAALQFGVYLGDTRHQDLLHVLYQCRACSATDPKDKVFAVFNLVHKTYKDNIPVDYFRTTEETYTIVAKQLITHWHRLDILSYVFPCTKFSSRRDELPAWELSNERHFKFQPSWAPMWNIQALPDRSFLPPQFTDIEMDFIADWDTTTRQGCSSTPSLDLTSLSTQHEAILQVGNTLNPWLQGFDHAQLMDRFGNSLIRSPNRSKDPGSGEILHFTIFATGLDLERQGATASEINLEDFRPNIPTRELRYQTLWVHAHYLGQIIVYGEDFLSMHGASSESRTHIINELRSVTCHKCASKPESPQPQRSIMDARTYTMEHKAYGLGMKVFRTEYSFGYACPRSEVGDSVWALDGARVPYVLRKMGDYYMLVGECYLDQALRQYDPCCRCGSPAAIVPMETMIIEIW